MHTMLAKAKTVDELRDEVEKARNAFLRALQSRDRKRYAMSDRDWNHIEAREGHLWAQYVAAMNNHAEAYVRERLR